MIVEFGKLPNGTKFNRVNPREIGLTKMGETSAGLPTTGRGGVQTVDFEPDENVEVPDGTSLLSEAEMGPVTRH